MAETTTARKRAAKQTTAPRRVVTDSHKAAMALGREEGAAIARYLDALEAVQGAKRRGRKRSPETIRQTLLEVVLELQKSDLTSINRVGLVQRKLDLDAELDRANNAVSVDPDQFVEGFIKAVKGYSERKGISYSAWREVGVAPEVLKKAGLGRGS